MFEPKNGTFPDDWVRFSSDLLNKEDLIVNETLIWQQDKAQAAYRHHLKKAGATSTQVPVHGKNTSMYKGHKDQVFPFLDKVFLSLKAAWREDKSIFPSL